MKTLQIKLKMATSSHHEINSQTEYHIHTIHQYLLSFTNSRGINWVNQLSHVQLAINSALGNSTSSSPFKIIYSRNVRLLSTVKIYPTNVSSANKHTSSMMKIQQETHKVLEFTKAYQTRVSQDYLKPAPPLILRL
jgi:hypothetical protein